MRIDNFSRKKRVTADWNGNKALPEGEQIAFTYTPLDYGSWQDATEVLQKVVASAKRTAEGKAEIDSESAVGKELFAAFKRLLPPNIESTGAPLLPSAGDDKPVTIEEIATTAKFIKLAIELLATLVAVSSPNADDLKN